MAATKYSCSNCFKK